MCHDRFEKTVGEVGRLDDHGLAGAGGSLQKPKHKLEPLPVRSDRRCRISRLARLISTSGSFSAAETPGTSNAFASSVEQQKEV